MYTKTAYTVLIASIVLILGFSGPNTPISNEQLREEEIVSDISHTLIDIWITAYSSTPEETDDTPFITASGERVRDGIIAANFLPFGTEVRIPELFGDKVFVVKDRMHRRKTNFVDIWMPSKYLAREFGIHQTSIEILVVPPVTLVRSG